jgi:3-dehydroquinate dehydratase/shikimate dehydrogenase
LYTGPIFKEALLAKICLCLTAKTLARNLELLEKYRKYTDIAELRVDCLDPDERLLIRRFPEQAGLPVILTIRRDIDGGNFFGGEGSRIKLLARGLAFADADRRRNFAYVDIEEDLNVPNFEEAARTFGTRVIRSYHNMNGVDADILSRIRGLRHVGDEIVKVAVMPCTTADVIRVIRASREAKDIEKILLCMGRFGGVTRILAEQLGSQISYSSAVNEKDVSAGAAGQLDVQELSELYRFREISDKTKIYGVTGFPLQVTGSPLFFNTIFKLENTDAVYVPIPADTIASFMELAEELGLQGVSVTVPYKEQILPYLTQKSSEVSAIGACNTITRFVGGWLGTNTDASGFADSLLSFIGKQNLKHKKITIIGAGGAARSVAFSVYRLGGRALILNRTIARARSLAVPYKFLWGGLDGRGAELMEKHSDIIIQTTPTGMAGFEEKDPMELYDFKGREVVMDIIYHPEVTPFLARAAASGCRILNGYDMLKRQAQYQYKNFMNRDFPAQFMSRVNFE